MAGEQNTNGLIPYMTLYLKLKPGMLHDDHDCHDFHTPHPTFCRMTGQSG